MTTGNEPEGNAQESGGEFRQKFEQTQQETAALRALAAEQFGVGVDDLKGVPVDQIKAKATEILETKKAQREQVLRESLEERGLKGDDLEAALVQLTGGKAPETPAQTPSPFASTGSLGGGPPGSLPNQNVRGGDRILAALQAGSKK